MTNRFTRRSTLALGAAALGSLAAPARLAAAPLSELSLWGPPAGPSAVLAHAAASGALSAVADKVRFTAWRNPDELRVGLTSQTITLSVVPVQAAANLYNRGFPIRLINVMTKGLLYVVSEDKTLTSIDSLEGKHLVVPFRGDTPDIILDRLLEDACLLDEVQITNTSTPHEAIQMLMAGRAEAALLPEPAISAAIMKGKKAGKDLKRVIDIQAEWGHLNDAAPVVPQAGLAATGPFLTEHGARVPDLHAGLVKAAASALADPMAAVLSTMAQIDPKKIGGKLPDDGFYLL